MIRARNQVIVEGVNLVKKHQAGSGELKGLSSFFSLFFFLCSLTWLLSGGIFTKEAPLPVSAVALIDPTDDKPCKTHFVYVEGGSKERQSKRTGVVVPRNDLVLKQRSSEVTEGPLDTSPEVAQHESFSASELVPKLNFNVAKRKD